VTAVWRFREGFLTGGALGQAAALRYCARIPTGACRTHAPSSTRARARCTAAPRSSVRDAEVKRAGADHQRAARREGGVVSLRIIRWSCYSRERSVSAPDDGPMAFR
jgi:hypothetical protein